MASLLAPRTLKRGLQIFALISAIGMAVLLVVTGAWAATLNAFTQVRPWWLMVALGLAASDWMGGGLRIWLLTRHVHRRAPFWGMVISGGMTAWAAYLTPAQAGAGPTMIYTMKRAGVPIPEAMTAALMSFLTTVVFFAVAGPLAVAFGAGRSLEAHGIPLINVSLYDVFQTSAAAFGVVGALMLVAVGFPTWTARRLHAIIGWLERHHGERVARKVEDLRAGVDRMHGCVLAYFRTPSGLLQMVVGVFTSGLAHANRLVAGYVAMRAFGLQAHFIDVLILQTTISFLLYFAPTPGGAGAAEGLSAALMSVYVPNALLPAYTIIWRFTVSYATVIFGTVLFYRMLHGRLDRAEETATEEAAPQTA
jgi:uncharacterized protein (TIRG00374 family)